MGSVSQRMIRFEVFDRGDNSLNVALRKLPVAKAPNVLTQVRVEDIGWRGSFEGTVSSEKDD